jgi:hypothetical protein
MNDHSGGWLQQQAAKMTGYANATYLTICCVAPRIEKGHDSLRNDDAPGHLVRQLEHTRSLDGSTYKQASFEPVAWLTLTPTALCSLLMQ